MLVTLASGFGVPIPVGARVDQKIPVSIHTTTSGWSVSAEREGCVLIPSLTETEPFALEPWFLSWGATSTSSVSLELGSGTGVFVETKLLLYHSFDGGPAHIVWNDEGVPDLENLLVAQGNTPSLGSVSALMYELVGEARVLVHSGRACELLLQDQF